MSNTKQSGSFLLGAEIPWEDVETGIKRKVFGYDEQIMMANVLFDKDAVGSLHNHPHSQVTHIVSGSFAVSIGEETKILNMGDSFYIPPMAMHGVVCLEAGMLVDVFSPQREDFLVKK
jgi:quercetin dioxygenase-like cupin family protein